MLFSYTTILNVCINLFYDKFIKAGIKVAKEAEPSPTQIVDYGEKIHSIILKD